MNKLRIVSLLVIHSLREFFAQYPLKIYLIAWFPRIVTQIIFFALLAGYTGGAELRRFALVGNAVHLLAMTSLVFVTASVTWERRAGTLPLLISSPANPMLPLSTRNFGMGLHGYLTGAIGLLLFFPLLGYTLTLWSIPLLLGLLLTVSFSCYGVGLALGGVALRMRGYHNFLSNLISLSLLCVSGVNIPTTALPGWAQSVAQMLPLTHGLLAIRLVFEGGPLVDIFNYAGREILVGAGYVLVAQFLFRWLLYRARVQGTLELY